MQLEGDLAFEKRSATVTLAKTAGQTTGEEVDVELLTIGGTGLSAFAGVNGGTTDEIGLRLTGVEFGLAPGQRSAGRQPDDHGAHLDDAASDGHQRERGGDARRAGDRRQRHRGGG